MRERWADRRSGIPIGSELYKRYISVTKALNEAGMKPWMKWYDWEYEVRGGGNGPGVNVVRTLQNVELLSRETVRVIGEVIPPECRRVFWNIGSGYVPDYSIFREIARWPRGEEREEMVAKLRLLARYLLRGKREMHGSSSELVSLFGWIVLTMTRQRKMSWDELLEMVYDVESGMLAAGADSDEVRAICRENPDVGWAFWRSGNDRLPTKSDMAESWRKKLMEYSRLGGGWSEKLKWLEVTMVESGYVETGRRNRGLVSSYVGRRPNREDERVVHALDGEGYRQMVWLVKRDEVKEPVKRNLVVDMGDWNRGEKSLLDAQELADIDRRESGFHILNSSGLGVRAGYEIEFPGVRPSRGLELLGQWWFEDSGIKHGAGGWTRGGDEFDEISPGPFCDFRTGEAVFRLYNRLGLIDMYRSAGFSFHYNVGVGEIKGLPELVWGMYLTGEVYNPDGKFGEEDVLKIGPPISGDGYIECKSFDMMSPHGFVWAWERLVRLSTALKASQERARGIKRGEVQLRLARIWQEYAMKLYGVMDEVKWGLPCLELTHMAVGRINEAIREVYPTVSSRYDRGRVWTVESRGGRVRQYLQEWPNVVAWAHELMDTANVQVKDVLWEVEETARGELGELAGRGFEVQEMKAFLRKYNVLMPVAPRKNDLRYLVGRVAWALGLGW